PHEEPDPGHLAREIDYRLARGVAGADEGDLLTRAELRLERRGPVVDGGAFELGEVRHLEAAVSGAARDHDRTSIDALVVGESELEARVLAGRPALQAHDVVGDRHLGPELLRLRVRARHQ